MKHCRRVTADAPGPWLCRHSQPYADSSGSPQAYSLREDSHSSPQAYSPREDSHSSSPDSWDPGHMQAQQTEVLMSFAERVALQSSTAKVGWHCAVGPLRFDTA